MSKSRVLNSGKSKYPVRLTFKAYMGMLGEAAKNQAKYHMFFLKDIDQK